jgi:OOP family OmpA-OmpF porin
MKLINVSKFSGVLALAAIVSPLAMAEDSGWYLGANIGQSVSDLEHEKMADSALGDNLTTTSFRVDDHDMGYKLFGGYQLSRYFALEGGYFNLGKFDFEATLPAGTLAGDIELQGVNLDAVGLLPFTDKFSAFARVGVIRVEASDDFSGTGTAAAIDHGNTDQNTGYKFGAGLQYALSDSVAVRAEAERYRADDTRGDNGDVDLFTVGILYRFGQKKTEPVAYVAPPEPPAPPPPPPAPPKKVSFSADSLFAFNKAEVSPAGKQALEVFAVDLKGTHYEEITVTGHTDRIGSHDYNMKLSTRRAEAVKAYLVESLDIPENKIEARGVDGSEPVTKPEDCKGNKATKELIACLQPDRRVEIDVSGTKK